MTRNARLGWTRAILPPITAALLVAAVFALAATAQSTVRNQYLSHGLYRSVLFVCSGTLERSVVPLLALFLLIRAAAWRWSRPFLAGLLGAGTALGVALYFNARHIGMELSESWLLPWYLASRGWQITVPETLEVLAFGVLIRLLAARPWTEKAVARLLQSRLLRDPRSAVALAALVAIPPGTVWLARKSLAEGAPHLVVVSLDTLRADHLGTYGYARETSPEIDRIAEESYVFEWAISQAPATLPSHMSLFTSLYPTVHGVLEVEDRLPEQRITLAEYLFDRGYRTAAITDGGFLRRFFGFDQGFERYDEWRKGIARTVPLALDWLDCGLAGSPFFLFLHTYEIHSPYEAPPPYRDLFADPEYDGAFEPTAEALEKLRESLRDPFRPKSQHGLRPADIAYIVARYDEGIRHTDHWIGELAAGLESRGLLDQSWLILLSDHGEEFTEHGSVHHAKLYHTVTRVPLIVRPPGGVRGRRIADVVELLDVMPSLLELLAIGPRSLSQGRSFLSLMRGEAVDWDGVAHSEFDRYQRRRSLTTRSLHVLSSILEREREAYSYRRDPLEQLPIGEAAPDSELEQAHRSLDHWMSQQEQLALEQPREASGFSPDSATEEELRQLGYLE